MPFRLIGTIILLLIVTIFAGANLDNRCDINFIFTKIQNVPVFLTSVVAFLAGAVIMIPFTFRRNKSKDKKNQAQSEVKNQKNSEDSESKTLFDFKIKRDINKKEKSSKNSWFQKEKSEEKNGKTPKENSSEKPSEVTENSDSSENSPQNEE